jgi:hypothetical protein
MTKAVTACTSLVELADVYNEWGGRFGYIQAAAALVKYSKLSHKGRDAQLLRGLGRTWLQVLPHAGTRACANVLWACVRTDQQQQQLLWAPTWDAFIRLVADEAEQSRRSAGVAIVPQHIVNALWSAAKLRKQPRADQLQLLVQAFLLPRVLAKTGPQEIANLTWALGRLCQLPDWHGGVSEQDVQQLLGQEQLKLVADSPYQQHVHNVLVALADLCGGWTPVISAAFARQCAAQLLPAAAQRLHSWDPLHVTNALWACSELGLADAKFVSAVVAAAPNWVPRSTAIDLRQAALACAQLQYRNEAFVQLLLQRALYMLQQQQHPLPVLQQHTLQHQPLQHHQQPMSQQHQLHYHHQQQQEQQPQQQQQQQQQQHDKQPGCHKALQLSAAERDSLAVVCSVSVAKLDMRNLGQLAKQLVIASGIAQQHSTHPSNPRRLYILHSWLLQHELLDGRGLLGVLTEGQLQQGQGELWLYGDGLTVV